jgi:hypothetical protein
MPDHQNPAASGRDESRLIATDLANDYTLALEEVSERYAKSGHPRTIRSLQRYCAVGHLDCQKVATATFSLNGKVVCDVPIRNALGPVMIAGYFGTPNRGDTLEVDSVELNSLSMEDHDLPPVVLDPTVGSRRYPHFPNPAMASPD